MIILRMTQFASGSQLAQVKVKKKHEKGWSEKRNKKVFKNVTTLQLWSARQRSR